MLNTRIIIVVAIIAVLLWVCSCGKTSSNQLEYFDNALENFVNSGEEEQKDYINEWNNQFSQQNTSAEPMVDDAVHADFTSSGKDLNNNLTSFSSADLLPKPDSEAGAGDGGWSYKRGANWDESNPQIKQVEGNAWLNERKFLGMYTVASSLRNATHDLRRDVPNPQMVVSPWNNTTMLPDSNTKGLCSF